jgi:hypothetical protein
MHQLPFPAMFGPGVPYFWGMASMAVSTLGSFRDYYLENSILVILRALVMNDWMKQRDLLIEETLEFVQGITTDLKTAVPSAQKEAETKEYPTAVQNPVVAEVPAPKDKLDMERTAILRRVANFKANQQRFQREREEYFQNTMAKARATQWTPESRNKR